MIDRRVGGPSAHMGHMRTNSKYGLNDGSQTISAPFTPVFSCPLVTGPQADVNTSFNWVHIRNKAHINTKRVN